MNPLTFRGKLTLWSTAVAVAALLIFGSVTAVFVYRLEVAELDEELRGETDHFFHEWERHEGRRADWSSVGADVKEWLPLASEHRFVEVWNASGVLWRSTNLNGADVRTAEPGHSNWLVHGTRLRGLVTGRNEVFFAIASDLNEATGLVRQLVLGFLAGLPLAVGFAWFGGRKLADLAVAPVQSMTEATERITAEHLDQRVPVPPVNDEIQRHAHVLNAAFDRLERSFQQAVRFSADASHELKTPLTVLRSGIESLQDSGEWSEEVRNKIAVLLEQTTKLADIIASLLLLARADAGKLNLDTSDHDLVPLIEACIEDAKIMADAVFISVESTLPDHAMAKVDALRCTQIITNILDNAVKYNQQGGRISVALMEERGEWRLLVGNSGNEIPPGFHDRLFERFFRAEKSSRQVGQGLGLSLSRELCRAQGGEVMLVGSRPGWTEFAATFPQGSRWVPNDNKAVIQP